MRQVICEAAELGRGQMIAGRVGPMPVVIVRTDDGGLYGLLDKCLHQGGQLSRGKLLHATESAPGGTNAYMLAPGREIVKCPWHGYEYDLRTGCTLFDASRKLRTFKVSEEDGQIVAET